MQFQSKFRAFSEQFFRTLSGQFQNCFRAVPEQFSEQFFYTFRAVSEQSFRIVSEEFWCSFSVVLEQIQSSYRAFSEQFFRRLSEQFFYTFRAVSEQSFRIVSEEFWCSFSVVLEQIQSSYRAFSEQFFRRLSEQFQSCFSTVFTSSFSIGIISGVEKKVRKKERKEQCPIVIIPGFRDWLKSVTSCWGWQKNRLGNRRVDEHQRAPVSDYFFDSNQSLGEIKLRELESGFGFAPIKYTESLSNIVRVRVLEPANNLFTVPRPVLIRHNSKIRKKSTNCTNH